MTNKSLLILSRFKVELVIFFTTSLGYSLKSDKSLIYFSISKKRLSLPSVSISSID